MPRRLSDLVREEAASRGGGVVAWLRAVMMLYRRWVRGGLRLVDPRPPSSFAGFLVNPAYSTWYWLLVAASLAPLTSPQPLRPLAAPLLFLAPGLATVEALYPSEESMSPVARILLALGLGLVIVGAVLMAASYAPIRILGGEEYVAGIPAAYTVLMGAAASYRKYRLLRIPVTGRR